MPTNDFGRVASSNADEGSRRRTWGWTARRRSSTRRWPRRLMFPMWRSCPICCTEKRGVWGDGAYQGQTQVIRECAPRAQDYTQRRCRYKGQIRDEAAWAKNRSKSKVRAKVENVFQVMKLKFGFVKVRYRGLKKNAHRLFVTCALVNLFVSG